MEQESNKQRSNVQTHSIKKFLFSSHFDVGQVLDDVLVDAYALKVVGLVQELVVFMEHNGGVPYS